jgi:hypothetical protein
LARGVGRVRCLTAVARRRRRELDGLVEPSSSPTMTLKERIAHWREALGDAAAI